MLGTNQGINIVSGTIDACSTTNCLDCKANYQACLTCNTAVGFYRQGVLCKNQPMLIANEGINTVTGTIVACSTPNCLDCKANYQTCISCNVGAAFYLHGVVCKNQGMLIANEGINSGAGTVVPCATTNCLDCKANYQICITCNTVVSFYLHGSVCKNQGMLIANEGINTAAGTVVPCTTSNCLDCKANYMACISCNVGALFYLHGTVCKNQGMLIANEGINTAAGTIVACAAANCVDCKADYQVCAACDTGAGFYLHGTVCKNQGMLVANEGINSAAGTVVACSTSNCRDCKANYLVCISCDTGSAFYLHGVVCKNQAMLGANEGINSGAGTIVACSVSNCGDCKANYQTCIACNTGTGYYLQGSVCKNQGMLVANEGINTATGTIVACATTNCLDCKADYQTCITCNTGVGFYRQGGVCKNQGMLVANEGMNTVAGTIVGCSTTNCLDCKANYQTCITCDTGAGYYLHGVVCKNLPMLGANEGINSAAGTIVACTTASCPDCRANYQICSSCDTGAGFYLQGAVCKNQAMLVANEGINAAAGTIVACSTTNCLDCKANYQTCILCNTGAEYYLQGVVCKSQVMLIVNEGINSGAGTIVACTTTNCLDCKADYQTCITCNTGAGFYLQGTVCKNQAMLVANEGINTAAGTVVACSTTNCLNCKANYQTCVACDTGAGFYLQGVVCKNQVMLVANEGINAVSGTIVACSTPYCLDCKANYQTCISCNMALGYYRQGVVCKNQAMLVANEGINTAAGTVVACSTSNCLDCKANYQTCISCNSGAGYYLQGVVCKNQPMLSANEGINSVAGTIVACATTNCLDCKANYQSCISCNIGTGFYLHGTVCKNQAMLIANQGINTVAGTIVACSTINCLDCKASYQTCITCNTAIGYYLQGVVCKNQAMLGADEGINTALGTVVACSTTNCFDCKTNYQVCVSCNTGAGFYLQGVVCKNQAMLGANEGINTGTGTIVACSTSNCLDCKANYLLCLSCSQPFLLHLDSCITLASIPSSIGLNLLTDRKIHQFTQFD